MIYTMQQFKGSPSKILVFVIALSILGGYTVSNVEGAHFTGPSTEVILKECKQKNIELSFSGIDVEKVQEFCQKIEELTTTFLQEFIHAILIGANTTAESLLNKYHNDFYELLLEFVP